MGEKLTVLNLRKKIKKYIKKPILINWMNENLKLISKSRKVSVRKPVLNGINEIIHYIKYYHTNFEFSGNENFPIDYGYIVDIIRRYNLLPLPYKLVKKVLKPYSETEEYKQNLKMGKIRLELLNESNRYKSYEEWLKDQEIINEARIDEMINNCYKNPDNWLIDFRDLNRKEIDIVFNKFNEFIDKVFSQKEIANKYYIKYLVGDTWNTQTLTEGTYSLFNRKIHDRNFIFGSSHGTTEGEILNLYKQASDVETIFDKEIRLFDAIAVEKINDIQKYKAHNGGFFKYCSVNLPEQLTKDLYRYQIFDKLTDDKGKQRKELNDCCFIYALQQTGEYSENDLNKMRLRIKNRILHNKHINEICEEFKIFIKLNYIDEDAALHKSRLNCIGCKEKDAIHKHKFNLFENHYFIEERTRYSSYYINNIDKLPIDKYNIRELPNKRARDKELIMISKLIRTLLKTKHFRPIKYGEFSILSTSFYDSTKDDFDYDLNYDEKYCTQLIKPRTPKESKKINHKINRKIYFADFETDPTAEYHIPFMVVLQNYNGDEIKTFKGTNCGEDLLNYLSSLSSNEDNEQILIYFHNLSYDSRFLMKYGVTSSIIKGSNTLSFVLKYNNKELHFRDSLALIPGKIEQFPKMFNLPKTKKELFPYNYFTIKNLEKNIGIINESGKHENTPWDRTKYNIFNENIDNIPGCRISENEYDMYKYAEFYCKQDVNILRLGFIKFREGFIKDFYIDVVDYITISSLANGIFSRDVYEPNGNLYKVGGHVRDFLSKAIYGGRCMCAYNKKWNIKEKIVDFDKVSLYPCAMSHLYTVEGIPKVIPQDNLNIEFLNKQSAFVVEIIIKKVNKKYPFPLIIQKDTNGLNLNDDDIENNGGIKMVVDDIYLNDLINFQKIEFDIIRGYYWDGKKDYTIQKVITKIFNKRVEYQREKNPLQLLYKLIMNSCYGKTIQKPIKSDHKYIKQNDLDNYVIKHYSEIKEIIQLDDSKLNSVKVVKPIDKYFNFSLLGIHVLSMSKRIMNEVMCLAYDNNCHIYYQDTDSIHIELNDLPILEKAYKEKYNKELVGKGFDQFHCDFSSSISGREDVKYSIQSIFLAKKLYIDELVMSDGIIEYMFRGKGLTKQAIINKYTKEFDNDPIKLYEYLYNGNEVEFDLAENQTRFKMNKNMTVETIKNFKRNIKVKYDEGNRELYFTN